MRVKSELFFLPVLFFVFFSCAQAKTQPKLQVVPAPERIIWGKGTFQLGVTAKIGFSGSPELRGCAELLNGFISGTANYYLPVSENKSFTGGVDLLIDSTLSLEREAYDLKISPDGIVLKAANPAGIFYGVQTLGQILSDARFYDPVKRVWKLPALQIYDKPAFPYRGMHLDVSRHFFPLSYVRKWIDLMATYKLNTLHWHLTDAAGWRIEIKKYPELTNIAAWRPEPKYLDWWKGERRYVKEGDAGAYGGYYTQEEIRELVAYAGERFVRIIPEIEMPGHSEEVLAVYPQLSCSGVPYKDGAFCVGNEKAFEFIEDVLTEVIGLFPSEYIHIGGDEVSKAAWKKCPKCQRRIKTEHLGNEKGLQSYMIHRVSDFLKSKGRKIIGWDEILEGGLAPDATVMSWRGEAGGIEAARAGHDVVMTPGGYCYFDSYQADPQTQPLAISGFTPYLKVYSYHPVPDSLTPEEAKHILGAQANVWAEYISTPEHWEYMVFPRLLALSEVVWTPEERKDVEDFKYRVDRHIGLLTQQGVNVFPLSDRIDILTEVDTAVHRLKVTLESEKYQPLIRYTLDGTVPDESSVVYKKPFYVDDSVNIRAALFAGSQRSETVSSARLDYHKAIGKQVAYKNRYSGSYPAAGDRTLTDGYRGGLTYQDGRWQGFLKDLDVTVDMGQVMDLGYVSVKFMQLTGPGVYMPDYVRFRISEDGVNFTDVAQIMNDIPTDKPDLFFKDYTARFKAKARYINVYAKKHAGFMFVDEIVVY